MKKKDLLPGIAESRQAIAKYRVISIRSAIKDALRHDRLGGGGFVRAIHTVFDLAFEARGCKEPSALPEINDALNLVRQAFKLKRKKVV
jgi:hypothetical protein